MHHEWQDRRFFLLKVLPTARMQRFTDLNFNWVNSFEIEEPHQKLLIEAQSAVTTCSRYAEGEPVGMKISDRDRDTHCVDCHIFLQESCYVKLTPDIWRAAVDAKGEGDDIFTIAKNLMTHLYERCSYISGISGVTTTSEQFFLDPRGVCQDFAHLMLAMCRTLGIAARYVSGYLFDSTRREMRGAHASHAWCEVFVPGKGWYGLDPTNCRLIDEYYIMLAVGRDYDDVAPVKGSFYGGGNRQMTVLVHIQDE